MRHRVLGSCLVAGSALLIGGCSSAEADTATFVVSGMYENQEVSVLDLISTPEQAVAAGVGCSGFRNSPIREGGSIEVVNDKGETVAAGQFAAGRWQSGKGGCVFPFEIPKVPAGLQEYRVTVGRHASNGPYSQSQVQNQLLALTWKRR